MKDIIEELKEQKAKLENFNSSKFNKDKVRLLSDAIFSLDECICELETL